MNIKYILLFVVLTICTTNLIAQNNSDVKYRRSSLTMLLIESDDFPYKSNVMQSWGNYPFPDKYDQQVVPLKTFRVDEAIELDKAAKIVAGLLDMDQDKFATFYKMSKLSDKKYREKNQILMREKIEQAFNEQRLGNQLVRTWFSSENGKMFDMSLIQKRGFYDASELDAGLAKSGIRGTAALADAGEELIKNTFITVTSLNFFENEPIAKITQQIAYLAAAIDPTGTAKRAADVAYNETKNGYSLHSRTFLYKLAWNDSIAAEFYQIWDDEEAFSKMDFQLEFVGVQYNKSTVTKPGESSVGAIFSPNKTYTQEQLIDIVFNRNIDEVFAKLQKENDVFKPKFPIITSEPLTAQIGMKEGLAGGEKFDILEMTLDPNTGRTKWVKVGTTAADKKLIWDNRYNAGDEPENPTLDKDGLPIKATNFKKNKKAQTGMLLKQTK